MSTPHTEGARSSQAADPTRSGEKNSLSASGDGDKTAWVVLASDSAPDAPVSLAALDSTAAGDTTFADPSVQTDQTYYYGVTAVDTASNESGFSEEASATPESDGDAEVPVSITVSTDANASQKLAVGLDPNATDSIDSSLGEEELPPLPPSGTFDARLIDDDIPLSGFGEGLRNDFRKGSSSFTGTEEHEIQLQPGDGATEVTISWDLPSGVTGLLTDVVTDGDQVEEPMSGSGSFTLTNLDLTKLYLTLDYSGNSPPSATPDSFQTVKDSTLTVETPGVLENDTDSDGDSLSASLVSDVSDGSLTLNSDGSFDYDPNQGFTGTDQFEYEASDGAAADTATATIEVSEPAVAVQIEDTTETVGDTVAVPIQVGNLKATADVTSYEFEMSFDESQLSYAGHETSGTLSEEFNVNENSENGVATVTAAGTSTLGDGTGSGVILRVLFAVESADSTTVTLTSLQFNEGAPAANPPQPSFVISGESQGLIAYYPFDGDATDASGNGPDGTVNGATLTTNRFGEPQSAYSFDGNDDYIQTGSSSALKVDTALTIASWIKTDFDDGRALAAQGTIFDTDGNWQVFVRDDSIGLSRNNSDFNVRSDSALSRGAWHHVAIVFSSGTTRFFVDGQLVSTRASGTSSFNTTDDGIKIGEREYSSAENDFRGKIDQFRLYNRALSETEVQTLVSKESGFLAAPGDLSATTSGENIDLNWSGVGTRDLSGYRIYRDTAPIDSSAGPGSYTALETVAVGDTTYADTTVTAGQTYYYRVTAVDVAGNESSFSGEDTATPSASELIAYYPFNETAEDFSGNDHGGTLNGGPQYVEGLNGQALELDGTDDYVRVSQFPDLPTGSSDFTISIWAYLPDYTGQKRNPFTGWGENSCCDTLNLFMTKGNGEEGYIFSFYGIDKSEDVRPSVDIPKKEWFHTAVTYEKDTVRIYQDGRLLISKQDDAAVKASDLFIGRNIPGTSFLKGKLDEVRIYQQALSGSEVRQLYRSEVAGDTLEPSPPTNLTAEVYADSVDLSWVASDSAETAEYLIYRNTAPIDSTAGPSSYTALDSTAVGDTNFVDTDVVPGETYYYRVTAVDTAGTEGQFSKQDYAILDTPQVAQADTIDRDGTFDFGPTGVSLSLQGVSGRGKVEVRKYDGSPDGTKGIEDANISDYRFVLQAGVTFDTTEVRLSADSLGGIGDPAAVTMYKRPMAGAGSFKALPTRYEPETDEVVGTVEKFSEVVLASDSAPDAPVSLTAMAAPDSVSLTWSASDSSDVEKYRVYRDTAPLDSSAGPSSYAALDSTAAGDTTFTDPSAQTDQTYYYRVTAVDTSANESGFSPEAAATPPGLETGVVAYYPFDGDATDASGNGNDGSAIGPTPTTGRSGQAESALAFDGTDDYVTLGNLDVEGSLTVSAWLRNETSLDSEPTIMEKPSDWHLAGADSTDETGLEAAGLRFDVTVDTGRARTAHEAPSADRWRHIVGVHDTTDGELRLFVDGVPVDTQAAPVRAGSDSALVVGADGTVESGFFDGTIDDVRLYDRVLTSDEVDALYRDGAPVPPPTVTVQDSVEQVALAWSAAGPSDVTEYAVYRDTTALDSTAGPDAYTALTTVSAPDTAVIDTSVATGETYHYRVAAIDTSDNESGFSAETSATASEQARLVGTVDDADGKALADFRVEAVSPDTTLTTRTDTSGAFALSGPAGTYAVGGEAVRDSTYLSHDSTTTRQSVSLNDTTTVSLDANTGYHLALTNVTVGGEPDTAVAAPGDTVTLSANYETWSRTNNPGSVIYAVAGLDTTATDAVSLGTPGAAPGTQGTVSLKLGLPGTEGATTVYATYAAQTSEDEAKTDYEARFPNSDRFIPVGTVIADDGAPSPPDTMSVPDTTGRVALSWSAVGADDLDQYSIYRSDAPIDSASGPSSITALATVPGTDTSYVDTSAVIDSTYHYRVTAADVRGQESSFSLEQQVTVSPSDSIQIDGVVTYYDQATPLENVALRMRGPGVDQEVTSASDGSYQVSAFARQNYTLAPSRPDSTVSPAQGLTTTDISLIRRDLLAEDSLESDYARLAADTDGSQSIQTVDIAHMRPVIAGDSSSLPGGLWRFVPSDTAASGPPFGLPDRRVYENLGTDPDAADFVALKRGDVDTSWSESTKQAPAGLLADKEGGEPVVLALGDHETEPGDTLLVPVRARALEAVGGLQFTLEWREDVLELVTPTAFALPGLSLDNFGRLDEASGRATVVWTEPEGGGVSRTPGDSLFALRYRVKEAGTTELSVTSSVTPRYAHHGKTLRARRLTGEKGTVEVSDIPDETSLEANYPNPVSGQTTIEYNLTEEEHVTMRLYDVLGRRVATLVDGSKEAGTHRVQVRAKTLSSGIYFYRFRAGDFMKTRRMMVVR